MRFPINDGPIAREGRVRRLACRVISHYQENDMISMISLRRPRAAGRRMSAVIWMLVSADAGMKGVAGRST